MEKSVEKLAHKLMGKSAQKSAKKSVEKSVEISHHKSLYQREIPVTHVTMLPLPPRHPGLRQPGFGRPGPNIQIR